jgi:hypothetical protein
LRKDNCPDLDRVSRTRVTSHRKGNGDLKIRQDVVLEQGTWGKLSVMLPPSLEGGGFVADRRLPSGPLPMDETSVSPRGLDGGRSPHVVTSQEGYLVLAMGLRLVKILQKLWG